MALSWETVVVPLAGGVDTKTDSKLTLPTKLTLLENGEFTKGGSVRKRFGHSSVRPRLLDGSDLSGFRALFTRQEELLTANETNLYSLDETTDRWVDTGPYCPWVYTATEAAYTTSNQTMCDTASVNGVTVYAWADSRGGVRYSVYNDDTGTPYAADVSLASSNATRPRVATAGTNLLVFYADTAGDNIMAQVIRSNDMEASLADSPVVVATDLAGSNVYDVVTGPEYIYLYYATDGTVVATDRICRVNAAGVASDHVAVEASTASDLVAVDYGEDDLVRTAGWEDSTGEIMWYVLDADLVHQDSDGPGGYSDLVNIAVGPNDDGVMVYREIDPGGADSDVYVEVEGFGPPVATVTWRHSGLGSSTWSQNGHTYVLLNHDSRTGLQSSYYLLRDAETIVGRVLSGEGPGVLRDAHLPRISEVSEGQLQVALQFRRRLVLKNASAGPTDTKGVFAHRGIRRCLFDTAATPVGASVGTGLYLTGSQLWCYDGVSAVESGFHMFPDMVSADIADSGSVDADLTDGATYNYRVYYEWYTATGERFRSAAITLSHEAATPAESIELTIPTLQFTEKRDGRTDIQIVVYRSEGNASELYYRVSSANPSDTGDNGHVYNDTGADTVTFVDGMSDDDLIFNEVDYITQGERPNSAPEGPAYVAVVQSRLWLVGGGQRPNNVRFSKLHFDGTPVEFVSGFEVQDAPDYGGDTVALGYINSAPVIFKERACYGLEGIGPDNTGGGVGYAVSAISSDTGCTEPGSVVSTADGIYFKGPEGIQLMGQNLEIQYVGAEVEAYNSQTCTAATGIPDTNQIVFLMSSGKTLMFDTYYKQWSTYTNHTGLSAEVNRGTEYVYLRSDSSVYRRDTSVYSDGGVAFQLKLRTAPLRLKDTVQGFWRARKLLVLGEYRSSHRLQVGVYYDRDRAPFDVFVFEPDEVLELGTWGSEDTWGEADTVWGGSAGGQDYQFQHRFRRQKCQSIRLEFEDLPSGDSPGPSFELAELALEVGLRTGLGRLPAVRKV